MRGRCSSSAPRGFSGFTLVELLVALVLIGVILAMIAPVVIQQIERAEAAMVVRDLDNLHTGMRYFEGNVRASPKYVTHLTNPLEAVDSSLADVEYSSRQTRDWKGPYVDLQLDEDLRIYLDHDACIADSSSCEDAVAWRTGFGGRIQNLVECFDAGTQYTVACNANSYTVLRIDGLTSQQFALINDLIDPDESFAPTLWEDVIGGSTQTVLSAWIEGRLRFVLADGIDIEGTVGVIYYLVAPWKNW